MNLNVNFVHSKDAFVALPRSVVEQIHSMDSRSQVRPKPALDLGNPHQRPNAAWCASQTTATMVFRLDWKHRGGEKQSAYVSWVGGASSGGSADIDVPTELGACLGLEEGQVVKVKVIKNVKRATFVNVTPLTEDDWEIVELYPVRVRV